MAKYIALGSSDAFFLALHEHGVLHEPPESVRRVVIDLQVGHPAKILYELYADNENLSADLVAGLTVEEKP